MKFIKPDREAFSKVADGLAVALAASLPWSTSATSIFAVLLLLAIIPTIDMPSLKRIAVTPAGGMPLVLVFLGVIGTLWADVVWSARFDGVSSFLKLLFIPPLLYQMSRSARTSQVLFGFLASCFLLLIVSWALLAFPNLPIADRTNTIGVPVKDYISQSAMFTICAFVIAQLSCNVWRRGRRDLAVILVALALLFLANVFYVATSRTSLVVIPVLLVMFGFRQFEWKRAIGLLVGFAVLAALAWPSAEYLRSRVDSFFVEVQTYNPDGAATSAGERLTFWTKSIGFIENSPIIGHGTGSIREQFRRSAVGRTGMAAEVAENPHNQILAVGIQLGLVGIVGLLAMWIAHVALFRSASFAAWVGLVVVTQNIVGSLFNSHLFDFTHGWAYVIGVGVAGGAVLKERIEQSQMAPNDIRTARQSG
ncbi:MAG: O-antigen ligase family protein [Pseudolabrys sp.]|nr:O-antigen ligase family protein [Pseudolabrys sp.]